MGEQPVGRLHFVGRTINYTSLGSDPTQERARGRLCRTQDKRMVK